MIKYLQWFGPSASFSTRARSLDLSLCILILAGCAIGARDDFKLRRDIDGLHLVKMPIEGAKARLAAHGFVCEKDTVPYEGSFLRSVYCVRTIKGLGCRDDEHVTLEYVAESSLVDRFATGRKNGCN